MLIPHIRHSVAAIVLVFSMASCSPKDSNSVEVKHLTFVQEFVLGEDISSTSILLAIPSSIKVDTIGNIYVSDRGVNQIFVFDRFGNFVQTIGVDGRGPGEFKSILSMTIDESNSLFVFDSNNARLNEFSGNHEFIDSYQPQSPVRLSPFRMVKLGENFAFLRKTMRFDDTVADSNHPTNNFIHIFGALSLEYKVSMGEYSKVLESEFPFVEFYHSNIHAGSMFAINNRCIWFTTGIYFGKISEFCYTPEGWSQGSAVSGKVITDKPFEIDTPSEHSFTMNVPAGAFMGNVNSVSMGFFRISENRIAHVSAQLIEGSFVLFFEIFGEDGQLQGVYSVENLEVYMGDVGTVLESVYVDSQNRLYVIEKDDPSVIRVGRIVGL